MFVEKYIYLYISYSSYVYVSTFLKLVILAKVDYRLPILFLDYVF